MNELEIFIEEIELYRGKTLNKEEVYQRLQEIKKELTKPLTEQNDRFWKTI